MNAAELERLREEASKQSHTGPFYHAAVVLSLIDALKKAQGTPDPAEAMRAKCQKVAEIHSHRGAMDYDLGYIDGRKDAADAIAALKGNGEGR
jgi:hypothetical protein